VPPVARRHVDIAFIAVTVGLVSLILVTVPARVPLTPYVYASGAADLKAVSESLKRIELPEWNPYLGGGYPLTPTPCYLLYGLNRATLFLAALALTIAAYRAFSSRLLAALLTLPGLAATIYTLHPGPSLATCYLAGLIKDSPVLRVLGSFAIPELALCTELALRRPSGWVVLASTACVVDIIAAYFGEVLGSFLLPPARNPWLIAYALLILATIPVAAGLAYVIHMATTRPPRTPSRRRWAATTAATLAMSVASLVHPGSLVFLAFPLLIALREILRRTDAYLNRLELRHPLALPVALILIISYAPVNSFLLSKLAEPRLTTLGQKVVGSGATAILSPDPWFTEVTERVLRGRPVANPPFLSSTPTTAGFAMLLRGLGDYRYMLLAPPIASWSVDVRLRLIVPRIASPGYLAASSADQQVLVEEWERVFRGPTAQEPKVVTPRTISGHGLVAQSCGAWWKHCRRGPFGLMVTHGAARYDRPTAPLSTLLALFSAGSAAITEVRRSRRRGAEA